MRKSILNTGVALILYSFLSNSYAIDTSCCYLNIDLSSGYNTNFYAEGSDPNAEPCLNVNLLADYNLLKERRTNIKVGYSLFWEEIYQYSTGRLMNHNVYSSVKYKHSEWLVRIVPNFTFQYSGIDPLLQVPSLNIKLQRSAPSGFVGAYYKIKKYIPKSTSYQYLDGNGQYVKLFWIKDLTSGSDIEFSSGFTRESIGDLDYVTNGTLPLKHKALGAQIDYNTYNEFGWELGFRVDYIYRNYDHSSSYDQKKRIDHELSGGTTIGYKTRKSIRYYLDYDFNYNISTLGAANVANKNYTQSIIMAGLSWEILP